MLKNLWPWRFCINVGCSYSGFFQLVSSLLQSSKKSLCQSERKSLEEIQTHNNHSLRQIRIFIWRELFEGEVCFMGCLSIYGQIPLYFTAFNEELETLDI